MNSNTRGIRVTRTSSNNNWIKNAPRNNGVSNNNWIKNAPRNNGVSNNNWIKNAPKNNGISDNNWIKNAPTIVGQNFRPWLKNLVKNRPVSISNASKLKIRSKNNISAVIKSARAKAALELYSKFRGYYINAHGFCVANSPKFTIPKDKAVLFVGKAGEFVLNKEAGNLERKLLHNNGRIKAFIQGSTSILKNLMYGDYKGRVYLPGEQIYEHYIHFTREAGVNSNNKNINNANLLKLKNLKAQSLGPSFGHIWKLPLPPGYSSNRPFVFSNNKNRIIWNLPSLLSRSINLRNNAERYRMRRQLQKLSTIMREGPPGVYIIGTCRQDLFRNENSQIKNYSNIIRAMGVQAPGLNQAKRYFSNVKKQNITNASRVPQISNTAALRSLPY